MTRRWSPGFVLSAMLGVASLAPLPATAQSGEGYLAFIEWCRSIGGTHVPGPGYGRCDPGSGSSSGGLYAPDGWGARAGTAINQWFRRQLSGEAASDARHRRAVEFNNQANATDNLDEALRLYRQAHDLWASPVIRLNLMDALIRVAGQEYQRRDPSDPAALDRMERLLNEAEALNRADMASLDNYGATIGWLHSGRNLIAQARADLDAAARNAAALHDASARISDIAGQLANELGDSGAANTSGLGFGDPGQMTVVLNRPDRLPPLPPSPPPFDRSVPCLEEVENSPGYEAWLRGMDAVVRRDWILAAAWFGTAQLRDPDNVAFRRAVDISEWTRDFYLRGEARQVAAMRAPTDEDLALLFPTPTPEQLPEATPEERRRMEVAAQLNTTLPEDADLFRDLGAQRNAMIEAAPSDQRRRLADRGVTLPRANDWTDTLAPEVRGMIAELREALPPRTYGPPNPDASPSAQLSAGVAEIGQGFADEAIVRILHGDLAAAERALNDAGAYNGGYGPALQLIQSWRAQAPGSPIEGLAPGGSLERR